MNNRYFYDAGRVGLPYYQAVAIRKAARGLLTIATGECSIPDYMTPARDARHYHQRPPG